MPPLQIKNKMMNALLLRVSTMRKLSATSEEDYISLVQMHLRVGKFMLEDAHDYTRAASVFKNGYKFVEKNSPFPILMNIPYLTQFNQLETEAALHKHVTARQAANSGLRKLSFLTQLGMKEPAKVSNEEMANNSAFGQGVNTARR
jgi:hypothetical protein